MSNSNVTDLRTRRDTRTAITMVTRGRRLHRDIVDAHRAAFSSDETVQTIRGLDDLDLGLLMNAVQPGAIDDPCSVDGWLRDVCGQEQDTRTEAAA